jgi:glycosyltransferase involved in cell wall biosynthesis
MSTGRMTTRPHVAHILSSFDLGGQERMALDLAASQVRSGYRVSAVSLAPPPDGPLAAEFRAAGAAAERVPRPRPGVDPILVLRLARWLRRNAVDLVHTHNRMALTYGAPAARLAGLPAVHTKHGKNPRAGLRLRAARVAARYLDAFVAVSPELGELARRRNEVEASRVLVIPNGIELGRFRPDPAARERVRAELSIAPDAWVVGTVGRIAVEKNQALLLRAMAPLLGSGSHLVVVGDGPLLPSLSELARTLAVPGAVHLVGARRDVPEVLNALDVFALTSDTEGLPLVILEAMATGLPVVSTDVGGIPDVVDDGETGFLVHPGDERALRERLSALQADSGRTRALGENARSRAVSRFSAERMQRDYIALYERVLSRRARGR